MVCQQLLQSGGPQACDYFLLDLFMAPAVGRLLAGGALETLPPGSLVAGGEAMSRAHYFWEEDVEQDNGLSLPNSRARTSSRSLSKHVVYVAWRVLRWASSLSRGGAAHLEEAGPGG